MYQLTLSETLKLNKVGGSMHLSIYSIQETIEQLPEIRSYNRGVREHIRKNLEVLCQPQFFILQNFEYESQYEQVRY